MSAADTARLTHAALTAHNTFGMRGTKELLQALPADQLLAVAMLAVAQLHDEIVLGCAESGLDVGQYLQRLGLELARDAA